MTRVGNRLKIGPPHHNALNRVGVLRHIQATRETEANKGPDLEVAKLLSIYDRFRAKFHDLDELRGLPFYQYLRFRTIHYDRVFDAFTNDGGRQIVFFGVGTDSRSLRFAASLKANDITVFETDLEPWIFERRSLMQKLGRQGHTQQFAFNMESDTIGGLTMQGGIDPTLKTLFIAEGVLTYISPAAVQAFLAGLSQVMSEDSQLALDMKRQGKREDGAFRLSMDADQQSSFFNETGFIVRSNFLSKALHQHLGFAEGGPAPLFDEDIVLVLAPKH